MLRKCLLVAFVLVILSSCNVAGTPIPATSINIKPTNEPLPSVPVENAESNIVIIGVVKDVSFSARLVMLKDPVEGFSVLALNERCKLTSSNGEKIELHDIQPGMIVQASGQPGASDALLTSFLLVQ